MGYARILAFLVCSTGFLLHAGQISLSYDFGSNVQHENSKERVEPFAKALYVLARYLIDPTTFVAVYDAADKGDFGDLLEDSAEKLQEEAPRSVAKKLAPPSRSASSLARQLLNRSDAKQIFQCAHRVGISDNLVITAAYELAQEWDDADAIKLFESIQKMKHGERRHAGNGMLYFGLSVGAVILGGSCAVLYSFNPAIFKFLTGFLAGLTGKSDGL